MLYNMSLNKEISRIRFALPTMTGVINGHQGISPRARSCLAGLVEMTESIAGGAKKKRQENGANAFVRRTNTENEANASALRRSWLLVPDF
jgi:hypothetical protein